MFNAHSRPVVPRAAIAEISRVAAGYLPGARMVRPSRRGGQGARMGARRGGKDHRGRGGAPAKRLACARIRPTRVPCVAPRVRHVKQTVSPSPGRRPATRDAAPLPSRRARSRGPLANRRTDVPPASTPGHILLMIIEYLLMMRLCLTNPGSQAFANWDLYREETGSTDRD